MKLDRHELHVLNSVEYLQPLAKKAVTVIRHGADCHMLAVDYEHYNTHICCNITNNGVVIGYGESDFHPSKEPVNQERIGRMIAFGRAVLNLANTGYSDYIRKSSFGEVHSVHISGSDLEDVSRGIIDIPPKIKKLKKNKNERKES